MCAALRRKGEREQSVPRLLLDRLRELELLQATDGEGILRQPGRYVAGSHAAGKLRILLRDQRRVRGEEGEVGVDACRVRVDVGLDLGAQCCDEFFLDALPVAGD